MRVKGLFIASVLGLGLTLALVWLLGGDLPVVRAVDITVQTYNDGVATDGKCTLREAIIAANTDTPVDTCAAGGANDYISLKAATYVLTATGTGEDAALTGDLDIADVLTIEGTGPGLTIIDASGVISDRVFDIRSGAGTVVISGVTIINGNVTGRGGGIYSYDADLTLINVEVISNAAGGGSLPDGRGGGVFVQDGSLLLDGAQILSNTASTLGGGVHAHSSACVFTQTGGTTIAHNHTNGDGGGLSIALAKATIIGGQVFSNTADGDGGGMFIRDGEATLNMTGVEIIENYAGGYGGGIEIYGGGVTMSGGQILSNTASSGGGGVRVNNSNSTLTQTGASLIAHNNTGLHGGGVFVLNGSATLNGGQVLNNTASYRGGGIYVNNMGKLTAINTTISGNEAQAQYGGGLLVTGAVTLTHATIASNTAASGAGGINWGSPGVTLLQNTIVAHNDPVNCNTGITSTGYNLDSGTSCGFTASGDITGTDPLLGPLVEDGGTWVHPLLDGSPAIDAGACVAGITTDQRGVARPQGDGCDIGAYEFAGHKIYLPLVVRNY